MKCDPVKFIKNMEKIGEYMDTHIEITVSYQGEHQPKLDRKISKVLSTIGFNEVGADYAIREQMRRITYVATE